MPQSMSSKTTSKNEAILNEISIILGIDYPMPNLDLLEKVLASISASISDHVGLKIQLKGLENSMEETRETTWKKRAEVDATWAANSL